MAFDIRIRIAPPLARAETPPPPPAPDAYWISGHWKWESAQYPWVGGQWERTRVGEVFVRAHWVSEASAWVFQPGHWAKIVAPPEFVSIVVRHAPLPPSTDYFWIAGHWRWEQHRYVCATGRWERHRPGFVWAPKHWVRVGRE